MYSCPELDGFLRPVPGFKLVHLFEECGRHGGDLAGVAVRVPLGQPAHNHVRVADRLNLTAMREMFLSGPSGLEPKMQR